MHAKVGQAVFDEIMQGHQRLFAGNRPVESAQLARMGAKVLLDQRHHFTRDVVLLKDQGRGHLLWPGPAKTLAILRVKIPLPAFGFVTLHQHMMLFAHAPVKILHAQVSGLACPFAKLRHAAQKMTVFTPLQGYF